jgi:hypothetical protein
MEQQKKPPSLFKRYGGRMTTQQIDQLINQMSMHPWEKEYVKRVFERYHSPTSPHVTEEEFKQGLDEMLKNTQDPIERNRIEQIKRKFGL